MPVHTAASRLRPVDVMLERQWDELVVRSGAPPFMRPGWLRAWMDAFAPGEPLHALTVESGGEPTAVLPLRQQRGTLRSPTNGESMIFSPVVADAAAAAELADRLFDGPRRTIDLTSLPVGGGAPAEALVAAAARNGNAVLHRTTNVCPFLDVSGDRDAFVQGLSAKRRQSLRRLHNRLGAAGEVTVTVHDGREHLDALLREGYRLEAREWKRAAGSAIISRPAAAKFYTAVARWAAENRILRLVFLRLDGRPIAFSYNLQQGGVLYGLKLGMDDEFMKFSPGVLLTQHLIDHAFADPDVRLFDYLGQNESYKTEYASGTREQVRLQVFPGPTGKLRRAAVVKTGELRASLVNRLPASTRKRLVAVRNRITL
ncbi:GNAT family N-acetyltransferase [Pseudonocardia zijingensis]|jgi:CelD/BcsL family acetyltransferase involved in cellulose biosynthesis|uniref:BioF2-like acetyltransferase domain-containing protein n=1 Tax=Pseudonocardia zijingensis TaxID=153376 RepID=A0ABP3ZET6_9PSEU